MADAGMSLWARLRRWREARSAQRRAIPEALWQATLASFPFLARLPPGDAPRLRQLTSRFLDSKEFSGAHGLQVTDEMAVAIAAQACLPILNLGLHAYDGFVGIVVHAGQVRARRSHQDDIGLVHEWTEELAGEAQEGGPVMLSWQDVSLAGDHADWGPYNVVIHEFAHVIDMLDGVADGVPPLPGGAAARAAWEATLREELDALQDTLAHREPTWLDPYAAEGMEELFAVASEAFFVAGPEMKQAHPRLYALLVGLYRQDTAAWAGG